MTIHRKAGSGFTNLPNEGARDKRLSWEAKGFLWFLLTEPSEVEIEAVRKEDPDLFRGMLSDLGNRGYALRWKNDDGTTHYEVFDSAKAAAEWVIGGDS